MALLLSGSVKNKSSPTGYTNLTTVQYFLGNTPTTSTGYTLAVINGISTWTNSLGNLQMVNGVITSQATDGSITLNPTGTGTVTINGPVNIPSLTTNLKIPVAAATTSSVDIFAAPVEVDGVTLVDSDRVLVRAQIDATQNGIYRVQYAGTGTDGIWVRSSDANSSTNIAGAILNAAGGITYGGRYFFTTFKKGQELGVDPINWYEFLADYLNQVAQNKTIDASPIGLNIAAAGSFTNLTVLSTTNSTGTDTGALTIAGGVGIGGDLWLGGSLYFKEAAGSFTAERIRVTGTDSSYNTTTGALQVVGGVGIGGDVHIGGLTQAESSLTGALTVAGGLGVGGNIYAGTYYSDGVPLDNIYWNGGTITSQFTVNNPANSFNTQSGAVVVQGGVGIGQDLYVGKSITLESRRDTEFVYFRMRNTATNGTSFTWDVGGYNRAGTAGASINEGSLTLFDDKQNTYRLAVSKTTGNLLVGGSYDNGVDKLQVAGSIALADSQIATRTTIINNANQTVIDSFPLANYRSTKLFVQITDGVGPGAAFHVVEIMIIVDNIGQTYKSEYGIATTQGERGTFDVDYNVSGSGLVRVLFTPVSAATQKTVKVLRSSITR
jgi:hypothetical protein